ncbi:SUMF1/EgtB/PvdO family nonheme iron enzyme [Paramagnetospirillum marisnigri]|uniref:SUMF1/EgtB/PvdO family nonheme iron enzyme n=1 Tax=Paramagnetospirillum marisnigri TaxID=1285242 RepID=UPI0009EE728F|nr:SUMF1/EgtB/PvdO family nonheme iron enzyme [Paramagnetospirillum marisnigri]
MGDKVFVSFSSHDRDIALRLVRELEAHGIPCWISCRDVKVGENYQRSIIGAIQRAPAMVLVFSSNANSSTEIEKELALASKKRLFVLPVRVDDIVPSESFEYELATRQWIDLFRKWDENIAMLVEVIRQQTGITPPPPEPVPAPPPPPAPDPVPAPERQTPAPVSAPIPAAPSPSKVSWPVAALFAAVVAGGLGFYGISRQSAPPPANADAKAVEQARALGGAAQADGGAQPPGAIKVSRSEEFSRCETNHRLDKYGKQDEFIFVQPMDAITRGSKDQDPELWFIRAGESKVTIWENTPGSIKEGACTDWYRVSNVIPPDGKYDPPGKNYIVIATEGCDVKAVKRLDETKPHLQVRYDVAYKKELGFSDQPPGGSGEYFYFTQEELGDGSGKQKAGKKTLVPDQRLRKWTDIKMYPSACQNIHIHYCGDGVVDRSFGEECDSRADLSCTPDCKQASSTTSPNNVKNRVAPPSKTTENYKPGQSFKDCPTCPEMVIIPPGSFLMGSPSGEKDSHVDERPQHRVTIAAPFALGKTEVTQAEWEAVMGNNPSKFRGANRPVENVSWDDVQVFIRKLNEMTGKRYRLPSEAEWEYAARAGTTTPWSCGGSETCLSSVAVYDANSGNQTKPVQSKSDNAFGLYDMHGNVYEWVQDCWHSNYSGAPSDGSAWLETNSCDRVFRGGSWGDNPRNLRSAFRYHFTPGNRNGSLGFRLARTLP